MTNFDFQIQTEELIPNCPYCGEVLDGMVVNGMHTRCNQDFAIELNILDESINETIHERV